MCPWYVPVVYAWYTVGRSLKPSAKKPTALREKADSPPQQ